eukprot:TRINITY_DN10677_c0_g2_i1.p1 TRINITY_DN10677_c0_g2~~TRINITY_DN10677_c0_g2_i1.p1  ORF type:complete len:318 (-),score=46.25 TRINITY_DN10677_c0_g2_i1:33-887(-)
MNTPEFKRSMKEQADAFGNPDPSKWPDGTETVGYVPEKAPPADKARRYVRLLLPGYERMLVGETPVWTQPYYRVMGNFNSRDLEWFAANCGLAHLCKVGHTAIVEKALLVDLMALHSMCKWFMKTPIVVDHRIPESQPLRKLPQYTADYASVLNVGPLRLFHYMITTSPLFMSKLSKVKRFEYVIRRFGDLATRTDRGFAKTKQMAFECLQALLKGGIIDQVTYDQCMTPITPPTPAIEGQYLCHTCQTGEGDLMKCSRCLQVRYCSVLCQKKDWATHKKTCKK